MRVHVHGRQGKDNILSKALRALGYDVTPKRPDVLLIDHCGPHYYRSVIDHYNVPTVLYDHGAYAYLGFDGIWDIRPNVVGYLAQGRAQRDIMSMFCDLPVEVVGWHFCETDGFVPVKEAGTVLFGPVHALGTGYIQDEMRAANRRVFENLVSLPLSVVVRHVGALEAAGLWREDGVEYVEGGDNTTSDIDEADAVVSHGTLAYLAVARGKPTVMFGQVRPVDGHPEAMIGPESWHRYESILRYPYDARGLAGALERACESEATGWRQDFIGEPMEPKRLDRAMNRLLKGVPA